MFDVRFLFDFQYPLLSFLVLSMLFFKFLISCMVAPPFKTSPLQNLVSGLEIACRPNHATRTVGALGAFLQHGPAMNETECLGSVGAIVKNTMASLATKDIAILEWMRHITRHVFDSKCDTMITAPMG